MDLGGFPSFGALPTGLQLTIWSEALSAANVRTIAREDITSFARGDRERPFRVYEVLSLGLAPHVMGLVCRHARRQMEHHFARASAPQHCGLHRFAGARYWLDLDRTIFYLGFGIEARAILNELDSNDLLRLRIVAFRWPHWSELARTCMSIAERCPNIHTLIVQRSREDIQNLPSIEELLAMSQRDHLGVRTAARFAKLSGYVATVLQDARLDSDHFRSMLLEYFNDTPLTLHLLQPDSIDSPALQQ